MADNDEPRSKIIVDEDWKNQVENEKVSAEVGRDVPEETVSAMPEASFASLVTSIATQAMVAVGAFPTGDDEKPPEAQPQLAKHLIDTLGMLEEKTKGNLTDDERQMLTGVVHDLRMLFVQSSQKAPATG